MSESVAHEALPCFPTRRSSDLVYPAYSEEGLRISFWGDEIEALEIFDVDSGAVIDTIQEFRIYPASHYVTTKGRLRSEEHTSELQSRGHLVCRLLLEKKTA